MNLVILLAAVFFAQGTETSRVPKPEDYPVAKTFGGKPAAPKLVTPGQRQYRTRIREATKNGPNFAGHYAIAEWGCGTGCIQMAVVDLEFGDVDLGPFETLCLGATVEADKTGIFYHLNSSLLIVTGCPNEKNCGTYYYAWAGKQFKLLRKDASKSGFGCAP